MRNHENAVKELPDSFLNIAFHTANPFTFLSDRINDEQIKGKGFGEQQQHHVSTRHYSAFCKLDSVAQKNKEIKKKTQETPA
ncbi:hypothetical protein V9T40_004233 [Parthenolecanium corni]|uniref:Uncharacterized protein n=1 Tax=Parthenolecanium corni TaxID=536013 RepID=A0AAN9TRP4_9HEMI